jgi:hypothetical protein
MENELPTEYTGASEYVFTAAEAWPYIMAILVALTVVGVAAIIWTQGRSSGRNGPAKTRGTEPGQGSTLVHAASLNPSNGNSFGESSRTWTVPKDPQAYAKGMMPGNRKK